MSAPFFQGNIGDLLNVAGQGQGSFLLGQMLNRQRQEEEAKIQQSVLGNLAKQQEMQQSAQKFPFDMQELQAKIKDYEAKTAQTRTTTAKTQFELDAENAAGGPQAAGGALKTKREGEQFALDQKKLDAMYDELSQLEWYQSDPNNPALDRDFTRDVGKIMEKYGLTSENPLYKNIIYRTGDPNAWKNTKEQIYLNTPKGRELKANREMAAASAMALQQERNAAAIRVAEIRAAQAEKAAVAKNYQAAVVQMEQAAEEAMAAGNKDLSDKYKVRANKFAELDQAARAAGATAGREGKVDVGRATGVPTVERPAPVVPYGDVTRTPNTIPPMPEGAVRLRK